MCFLFTSIGILSFHLNSRVRQIGGASNRTVQRRVLNLGELNTTQTEQWQRSIEVIEAEGQSRQRRLFTDREGRAPADAADACEVIVSSLSVRCAMISRMRVMSLPRTVVCAEKVMRVTTDTYFAPNKTIHELHDELTKSETGIDPLKDFSEAARDELRAFTSL